MSSWPSDVYMYIIVQKEEGNFREEGNNDQVMYERKKIMIILENDAHSF